MRVVAQQIDVVVIGAGAAGLFCAADLGQAGLRVKVVDNGKKPARKVIMSGGGRCNFTNLYTEASAYVSNNPHFCKSALARYSQWDFIDCVNRHKIAYHEKALGQLFCDDSSEQIVTMLLDECCLGNVEIELRNAVQDIEIQEDGTYLVACSQGLILTKNVVVASGGLSMPALGASPLGYRIAEKFGLAIVPTRPGLVPFTLHKPLLASLSTLAGISVPVTIANKNSVSFKESLLFTHRGLSGPAILQASSYWQPGEYIEINLLPDIDIESLLNEERERHPNQSLKNALAKHLPKRLIEFFLSLGIVPDTVLKGLHQKQQRELIDSLQQWSIQPNGTEGYRTAEVTLGGIDTQELSSKTMEAHRAPGLYFIGEVVDVTGWLGGYNFQWAWSSARACSSALINKFGFKSGVA